MPEITVYTTRGIHTVNPSMPRADAVAVRDGRIVEVGRRTGRIRRTGGAEAWSSRTDTGR